MREALLRQIRSELEEFDPVPPALGVACSGGIDSTVLLDLLHEAGTLPLVVLHLNYHLRGGDSDEDEAFVRTLAEDRGLDCHVLDVDTPPPSSGVQEWARDLRLGWFRVLAEDGVIVALGQQKNDLAETGLFRLARGASVGNLAGMGRFRDGLYRPLLDLSRREIEELASGQNLPHRHDLSNDKLFYSRNVIRHKVLPELETLAPGAAGRIAETVTEAAGLSTWVRRELVRAREFNRGSPDTAWLRGLPDAVALEALSMLEGPGLEPATGLSRSFLKTVLKSVREAGHPDYHWQADFPGGGRVIVTATQVRRTADRAPSGKARHAQYKQALLSEDRRGILGPGASVTLDRRGKALILTNRQQNRALVWEIRGPVMGEKLYFAGSRGIRLKDMPKLRDEILATDGFLLSCDDKLVGIYDGAGGLYRPAPGGGKIKVEPGHLSLQTLGYSYSELDKHSL